MLCYINKLAIPEAEAYLHKIKQLLSNPELYGKEASYRRRKSYDPLWNRGDLFAHTLMCPMSERLGIKGWKILLYKVSEFVDDSRHCRHIMLVSICPPEEEPSTSLELQKLGFVRMMRHDEKWDYLVQISLKNQKDLLSYELTKVANISEVAYPSDGTVEDPLVSMPLFGRLSKEDRYPHYESLICRLYRDHKCSST